MLVDNLDDFELKLCLLIRIDLRLKRRAEPVVSKTPQVVRHLVLRLGLGDQFVVQFFVFDFAHYNFLFGYAASVTSFIFCSSLLCCVLVSKPRVYAD